MIAQKGRLDLKRILYGTEGQSLPLVLMFMLVLMGALALVVDGGNGYFERRHMQNAADAAALAAATTVVKGEYRDSVVRQVAAGYAQQNGAASVIVEYLDQNGNVLVPSGGNIPSSLYSVRATAQCTFPTIFARVMGIRMLTASARASAHAEPGAMPSSFTGLAPLSVPTNFYDSCAAAGVSCDLWDSQYAHAWGIPANEYKSLIDLSFGVAEGSIPTNISDWTLNGYPGVVDDGSWVPTITGNYGNNVAGALRERIADHPTGVDPDGVVWGYIDMVVWDGWADTATGLSVHIAKFGRFKVRLTDVSGSHTYGHFVDFVVAGHTRGGDLQHTGPRIIVLGS
jgi:hypothetical protein